MSSNLECNESSILFFMERTPLSSTSFSNTLVKALTSGITCNIEADSAEIFLVISSMGDRMLIILVAISSCEAVSTGIDPLAPMQQLPFFVQQLTESCIMMNSNVLAHLA